MVKKSSTIWIQKEHILALQKLAGRLGYTGSRGSAINQGSASALIRALADDPVKVAWEIVKLYGAEAQGESENGDM
jgi:hypothetical protein